MFYSITISFPTYRVMKDFVGSFDQISDCLDYREEEQYEEPGTYLSGWHDCRFTIGDTEVSSVSTREISQYFFNGSTGGFDWVKAEDGSTQVVRHGIINPRYQG